jgi:hypothetical protein
LLKRIKKVFKKKGNKTGMENRVKNVVACGAKWSKVERSWGQKHVYGGIPAFTG